MSIREQLIISVLSMMPGLMIKQTYAQPLIGHKDTIYYLLDTLHTPVNDRMVTGVGDYMNYRFYHVLCSCLKDNVEPVFRCNITLATYISKKQFRSLKFTSLPNLIGLVKKNDDKRFDDRFVIYFIEPLGKKYIKRKCFFQGGGINSVIDYVIIPTDTLTAKHTKTIIDH